MKSKHREEFSKSDPSSLLHVAEGKRLLEVNPTPSSLEILYSVFDRHGRDESRQPTPTHPENVHMRHLSQSFYQPVRGGRYTTGDEQTCMAVHAKPIPAPKYEFRG